MTNLVGCLDPIKGVYAPMMASEPLPLTDQEWKSIYQRVPRLCVELIIRSDAGVLLTLRDIEPCKGLWHIPGGTVRYAEPLVGAIRRTAQHELGIISTGAELLGYIEYPSHYLHGLDCPVGIAFDVAFEGEVRLNNEAKQWAWFKELPEFMHDDQGEFLVSHQLVSSRS